jgi:hypothetical protein
MARRFSRRQFNCLLLQMASATFYGKSVAGQGDLAVFNGQSINLTNVGRAGAAFYSIPNFSANLTTINGNQIFDSDQTIRNANFTGIVTVTGGRVAFEFCQFTVQPPSATMWPAAALQQYNGGQACGTLT